MAVAAPPGTAADTTTRHPLPQSGGGSFPTAAAASAPFWCEREQFRAMSSRPKRTILLVEDEVSITEPLAEALRSEGFETQVAGTVAEALDLAKRDPDLVLLDLMLPDGSGFDVCRELRKRSQVPIIMCRRSPLPRSSAICHSPSRNSGHTVSCPM